MWLNELTKLKSDEKYIVRNQIIYEKADETTRKGALTPSGGTRTFKLRPWRCFLQRETQKRNCNQETQTLGGDRRTKVG